MIEVTTEISFTGIFRQSKFSYKQAQSNSFYLTLLPVFLSCQGKNGIQTKAERDNKKHALKTNLACIFL